VVAAAAAVVTTGAGRISIPACVSYGSEFDFDDDTFSSGSKSDDNASVITLS